MPLTTHVMCSNVFNRQYSIIGQRDGVKYQKTYVFLISFLLASLSPLLSLYFTGWSSHVLVFERTTVPATVVASWLETARLAQRNARIVVILKVVTQSCHLIKNSPLQYCSTTASSENLATSLTCRQGYPPQWPRVFRSRM